MSEGGYWTTTAASSVKDDWATPRKLYESLNAEFDFTIDVCANEWNAKHDRFFDPNKTDALLEDWSGERCFMNPPYGRGIAAWIAKARRESERGALVVGLIPARTDTRYWWSDIFGFAEVRFLKGRVKFERIDGATHSAPFPSAVVIWRESK